MQYCKIIKLLEINILRDARTQHNVELHRFITYISTLIGISKMLRLASKSHEYMIVHKSSIGKLFRYTHIVKNIISNCFIFLILR